MIGFFCGACAVVLGFFTIAIVQNDRTSHKEFGVSLAMLAPTLMFACLGGYFSG